MNRYSKYFLNHLLWLDDGFCQYYLQNPTWATEEILDVEAVVFDWPEEAEQWLFQCAGHDPVTTLRHLRVFLADHCLEHYNLHRMNDRQVIKAAARQICLNLHRIVIEPRLGWAVQVDPLQGKPVLPVSVEPDSEYSHLLEELQTLLNDLVADQKKRYDEWEARMAGMNRIQRTLFIKKQIDDASKEHLKESALDTISFFAKFYPVYLKTLWKVTMAPARMGMLTAEALATGSTNPLKEEIDKIVNPVARTYEEAQRYKTMLTILLSNPTTHETLWDFAKRYYEASHPIDLGRTGAKAVTEIMLNILLALVSAGAAVALNAAAKSVKLVKVAKLLEKIAFVIKRLGPESKVVNKLGDLMKSEKKAAKAARKAEKLVPDKKHKPPESLDDGAKKEYGKNKDKDGPKTTHKTIPPRDRLAELSDTELEQVRKVSTFKTKGVSEERAIDYLSNTPEGQKVLRQVSESAPAGTDPEVIFNRAMGYVQSGTDLPKTGTIDSPLVKIAPKGQGVSDYSPYFTTMDELKKAQSSNKPLSDLFGLPANSDAAKYDVFQIKAIDKANVLKSKIAPTEELGGKFVTQGGAEQIIVPNRKQFTAPERLFSINDNM